MPPGETRGVCCLSPEEAVQFQLDLFKQALDEPVTLVPDALSVGFRIPESRAVEPEYLFAAKPLEVVALEVNVLQHDRDQRLRFVPKEPGEFVPRDVLRPKKCRTHEQQSYVALPDCLLDLIVPVLADKDVCVAPEDVVVSPGRGQLVAELIKKSACQVPVGTGVGNEDLNSPSQ